MAEQHAHLVSEVKAEYAQRLSDIDAGFNEKLSHVEKQLAVTVERIAQKEKELAQKLELAVSAQSKSEEILRAIQEEGNKITAAKQSKEFTTAATAHDTEAMRWACASIGIATAILFSSAYAAYNGSGPPLPTETWTAAANISHFAARALAMSILSFLLVLCARNYRSAKHNAITNGHRAKALNTFDQFKNATEGRAQDVILVQATTAIFSPQPTGYVDGSMGPGTHVTELLRVVRPTEGEDKQP
jgi:hypothetical protein